MILAMQLLHADAVEKESTAAQTSLHAETCNESEGEGLVLLRLAGLLQRLPDVLQILHAETCNESEGEGLVLLHLLRLAVLLQLLLDVLLLRLAVLLQLLLDVLQIVHVLQLLHGGGALQLLHGVLYGRRGPA